MHTRRTMMREMGTAFAVLALYLLTVLAPLHQARASQLAFEELGYSTTEAGWVFCAPAGPGGDNSDVLVAKCPATGIGKSDLARPDLDLDPVRFDHAAILLQWRKNPLVFLPPSPAPPGGPRGPPVQG